MHCGDLRGDLHRTLLWSYMLVVFAHWGEHLFQAYQIWILGWARTKALGMLGFLWPSLVKSEWLHWGYAVFMLVGLYVLLWGFEWRLPKTIWAVALGLQAWHFVEHSLLFAQAQLGFALFGKAQPTSLLQLFVPRAELHLYYNLAVLVPMLVAVHLYESERRRWLELA